MARFDSRQLTFRSVLLAAMLLALASCVGAGQRPAEPARAPPAPTAPPVPPPPANAVEAGVRAGPRLDTLGVSPFAAGQALVAFRTSCPDLVRRQTLPG
jgi:membrane-bound lytic murein transglycosylase A